MSNDTTLEILQELLRKPMIDLATIDTSKLQLPNPNDMLKDVISEIDVLYAFTDALKSITDDLSDVANELGPGTTFGELEDYLKSMDDSKSFFRKILDKLSCMKPSRSELLSIAGIILSIYFRIYPSPYDYSCGCSCEDNSWREALFDFLKEILYRLQLLEEDH